MIRDGIKWWIFKSPNGSMPISIYYVVFFGHFLPIDASYRRRQPLLMTSTMSTRGASGCWKGASPPRNQGILVLRDMLSPNVLTIYSQVREKHLNKFKWLPLPFAAARVHSYSCETRATPGPRHTLTIRWIGYKVSQKRCVSEENTNKNNGGDTIQQSTTVV